MDYININQELTEVNFLHREYDKKHSPYEGEFAFYEYVKEGNIEQVEKMVGNLGGEGMGLLSKDPKRNLQYHLVVSIALISRFCVEGGMEYETAFNISDLYIQKLDLCATCDEVISIHRQMVFDYTKRMEEIRKKNVYSKPIIMCIDYIYNNLHHSITIPELAELVALTPPYLSKLFINEVGTAISSYIREKRIEAAKNMLKYSQYSFLDIGNYLSFSSQSHFISVFKKYVGMTPKQYRDKNFRINWSN